MPVRISELTASVAVRDIDVLPIVSGGMTYKATPSTIMQGTGYPSFSASLKSFSASVQVVTGTLLDASASFVTQISNLEQFSGTVKSFSASVQTVTGTLIAASASFRTQISSLEQFSGTLKSHTASIQTFSASMLAASASFNGASSSYAANRPRIEGTVVLSVSGTNVGDIRLTGNLYSSGVVYRRGAGRTITANGPILDTDQILFVSATTANLVLTATNPNFQAEPILIKKITDNAYTIQIARFGSERIEGAAATYTLTGSESTTYPAWTLMSDGTNWWMA
jgi:hypothetical protein